MSNRQYKKRIAIHPGDKFGSWTVIERAEDRIYNGGSIGIVYKCRCEECGTIKNVLSRYLVNGKSKCCRECYLSNKRIKLNPGDKFGKWTVIGPAKVKYIDIYGRPQKRWECACECGNIRDVLGVTLKNGRSKSCGCQRSRKKAVNESN